MTMTDWDTATSDGESRFERRRVVDVPVDFGDEIEDIVRRLYDLMQMIQDPNVVGSNKFEEIELGPAGQEVIVDVTPTAAPTNVQVAVGAFYDNIFADVSWSPPPGDAIATQYSVEIAKKVGASYELAQVRTTLGTSMRVERLEPQTTYAFRVTGQNRLGIVGASSAWAEATTGKDNTPPPAITNVVVGRGATTVVVKFDPSTAPDVKDAKGLYEVQIDTSPSFNTGNFRSVRTTAFVVAFNDVTAVGFWYARVSAIDSSGNQGVWTQAGPAEAGGVVDYMIVAGLDAAKITFGQMSGDRIQANTASISILYSSSLTAADITLAGGSFRAGSPPTTGLLMNSQGIRLYQGGVATIVFDAITGTATFTGAIASGSTITGTTIQGSTFQIGGGDLYIDANGLRFFENGLQDWNTVRGLRWVNIGGGYDVSRIWTGADGFYFQTPGSSTAMRFMTNHFSFTSPLGSSNIITFSAGDNIIYFYKTTQFFQPIYYSGFDSSAASNSVGIDFAGMFYRYTSSRRWKHNIGPVHFDTEFIFDLEPVEYDPVQPDEKARRNPKNDGPRQLGVIAEDVQAAMEKRGVDPKYLVAIDPDGNVTNFYYDKLPLLLLAEMKKLRERVAYLESLPHNRRKKEVELV